MFFLALILVLAIIVYGVASVKTYDKKIVHFQSLVAQYHMLETPNIDYDDTSWFGIDFSEMTMNTGDSIYNIVKKEDGWYRSLQRAARHSKVKGEFVIVFEYGKIITENLSKTYLEDANYELENLKREVELKPFKNAFMETQLDVKYKSFLDYKLALGDKLPAIIIAREQDKERWRIQAIKPSKSD